MSDPQSSQRSGIRVNKILGYSIIPGVVIGLALFWWTTKDDFAVKHIHQQIEAAVDRASGEQEPRRRIAVFIAGIEIIDTSGAPEDFRALFEEYVRLFQRGLADYDETGVMGRYDAQIEVLSDQIKSY